MDLHTTCKEYDFCTPETRAELAANGFDFSICKFGITEFIAGRMKMGFIVETNEAIPYPTFTEVWRLLPESINIGNGSMLSKAKKGLDTDSVHYKTGDGFSFPFTFLLEINITEAVCLLWLQLKKGGFLNG